MPSDFDKQFKGILNSVRSTINPDYAIPKEKANEPINVRIQRMKDATTEISNKIKELSTCLSAFTTNLNALTEEVQPYVAKESEVKPDVSETTANDKPEETPVTSKPAPETTETKKAEEKAPESSDADKK